MFIYKNIPWVRYLDHKSKKEPNVNWYEISTYIDIRIKYKKIFNEELIKRGGKLGPLFTHLSELYSRYKEINKSLSKHSFITEQIFKFDYNHLVELLPDDMEYKKP